MRCNERPGIARPAIDAARRLLVSNQLLLQRQQSPARVSLSSSGCANPRAIAQAIPGARAMVETAVQWFLSVNPRDQARVDLLMRANFLSDDDDARFLVETRLLRMLELLRDAESGSLTFVCEPASEPACDSANGFVRIGERGVIHVCPSFFGLTLEGRRWNLIHECAHAAGAVRTPEGYHALLGPIGEEACRDPTQISPAHGALGMADNYAKFVWCLTRRAGIEVEPP